MIRDVLTQGIVKEFQRSLSIDKSPLREITKSSLRYGLMAGRNSHKAAINWVYVFIAIFLTLMAGNSLYHSSIHTVQSAVSPSNTPTSHSTAIHVAHLALKLSELQEKVHKASVNAEVIVNKGFASSLPTALADLKLERTRSWNVLEKITIELSEVAKVVEELKQSQSGSQNPIDLHANEFSDYVSKGDIGIASVENARPTTPVQSQEGKEKNSDPFYDFFDREEIRNYIKVVTLASQPYRVFGVCGSC